MKTKCICGHHAVDHIEKRSSKGTKPCIMLGCNCVDFMPRVYSYIAADPCEAEELTLP
jgi:hypothetical protein